MSVRVGRFFVTRTESVLISNCSDNSSATKFDGFGTKDFIDSKMKESGENLEPEMETTNGVSTSRGKFRKCLNGLKRFKNFFKRYSTNDRADTISNAGPNSDKKTSNLSTRTTFLKNLFRFRRTDRNIQVTVPTDNLTSEGKIEEFEMKTLETVRPPNEEETLTDTLSSTSFENLNPLMSPVRQKKLIACAKIEKLKNCILRTWEINQNLDEAKTNFTRKKSGRRMVHFADPVVSAIFNAEEEPEISLDQRIKIFFDEAQNLKPEVKSNEDVEHLQNEKENLVPVVETSKDTEYLQDGITSAEKMQMVPAENDKPELLTGMKKWYVRRVNGKLLNGFEQVRELGTPLEC